MKRYRGLPAPRARPWAHTWACNGAPPPLGTSRAEPFPARRRARNRAQLFPAPCCSMRAATKCRENVPPPRAKMKQHPCNETTKATRQHVAGRETGLNCSPRRAAARERLRFTGETFPGACWSDGFVPEPLAFTSPGRELELRLRERMAPSTCKIVRRSGFINKKLR